MICLGTKMNATPHQYMHTIVARDCCLGVNKERHAHTHTQREREREREGNKRMHNSKQHNKAQHRQSTHPYIHDPSTNSKWQHIVECFFVFLE